eukprot:COSAG04_NODE_4688_length_1948_cov_1.544619_1_plen_575_part_10
MTLLAWSTRQAAALTTLATIVSGRCKHETSPPFRESTWGAGSNSKCTVSTGQGMLHPGEECFARCKTGFSPVGDVSVVAFSCESDGGLRPEQKFGQELELHCAPNTCEADALPCGDCQMASGQAECGPNKHTPTSGVCNVVCAPGFHRNTPGLPGSGPVPYSCNGITKLFEPQTLGHELKCRANPCPRAPCANCECTTLSADGTSCKAVCEEGFVDPKHADADYTCSSADANGQWKKVHDDLKCNARGCTNCCPTNTPLQHQHWRHGGENDDECVSPYKDSAKTYCKVDCDEGFVWTADSPPGCAGDADDDKPDHGADDPDDSGWYTCHSKNWVPDDPDHPCKCEGVPCPAGPIPGVSGATSCPEGRYSTDVSALGATCTIKCDVGYENVHGVLGQYKCGANQKWQRIGGSDLECRRTCSSRLPVPHSLPGLCVGRDERSLPVHGETCDLQCRDGYVESMPATFTCSEAGSWTTDGTFECIPDGEAKNCSDTPGLHLRLGDDCNKTQHDVPCTAECEEGFERTSGSPMYMCSGAGHWYPKDAASRLECTGRPSWTHPSETTLEIAAGVLVAICLL